MVAQASTMEITAQASTSGSVGPTSTWETKSSYNYSFPALEFIKLTIERFLYFTLLTRAQFYGFKCRHLFSRDRRLGLDQKKEHIFS